MVYLVFCQQAKRQSHLLPARLQAFLKNEKPCWLIRGIVYDEDLPLTPENNRHHIGSSISLARIQAIIMSFVGNMIAYEGEGGDRLFQDIVPHLSNALLQTSTGSLCELEIHTEQAFSPWRPDFITLGCLRGHLDAITFWLPVTDIPTNMYPLLRQPLWTIGVDLSFQQEGVQNDVRGPIPILEETKSESGNETMRLCFDQDLMKGTTESSENALHEITRIYYEKRAHHVLQKGDMLILDNNRIVHGRSPFLLHFNGTDRFLVRCFAMKDYTYERSMDVREGRILLKKYS